jgi:hypothetical protein
LGLKNYRDFEHRKLVYKTNFLESRRHAYNFKHCLWAYPTPSQGTQGVGSEQGV